MEDAPVAEPVVARRHAPVDEPSLLYSSYRSHAYDLPNLPAQFLRMDDGVENLSAGHPD